MVSYYPPPFIPQHAQHQDPKLQSWASNALVHPKSSQWGLHQPYLLRPPSYEQPSFGQP